MYSGEILLAPIRRTGRRRQSTSGTTNAGLQGDDGVVMMVVTVGAERYSGGKNSQIMGWTESEKGRKGTPKSPGSCTESPGASLVAQMVNNLSAMRETWVWSLGWEDPLEKGMATHSSILVWRIPWAV